jgi:CubicO group peptidase (beta-lactamase class C family)
MVPGNADLTQRVANALPPHAGACVLAMDKGQVVFEQAWGLADVETSVPCTPETNFRMASVSKQFTATAVMLLVERGQLSLQDSLTKFFPGFPEYGQHITVKHLLTHTSGLPAYEELIPAGTKLQLNDLDVLRLLMDTKEPRFSPGEKFEYSNSGYALLGLIVEVVARKPFHEFMSEEVFRPLRMNGSVLYQRGLNDVPRRAFGHRREGAKWIRDDQSLTSAVRGDGAIYTSLRDYQNWLRAIDEQQLLSAVSYAQIFSPHVVTDRAGSSYGFGWFIDEYRDHQRIHHNGDTRGFRLCVQRFPRRRAALVVQLNSEVAGSTQEITRLGELLSDLLIFDRPNDNAESNSAGAP